jgi:hypothetical protein
MKKFLLLISLIFIVSNGLHAQRNWKLLGIKRVDDRLERDAILVGRSRGDFKALLIKVKGASVDFRKVKVVFGNGQEQEAELRNTIPSGGSSRVIDLQGGDRVIREIIFWYDANTLRGKKAIVRVFART